jgi:hypothetical protein
LIDPTGMIEMDNKTIIDNLELAMFVKNFIIRNANDAKVLSGMKEFAQLDAGQVKEALSWGKGPKLRVVEGNKMTSGADGEFDWNPKTRIGTKHILLRKGLLQKLASTKGACHKAFLSYIEKTILHELVHWGDEKDSKDYPLEEGDLFEIHVWGEVSNPPHCDEEETDTQGNDGGEHQSTQQLRSVTQIGQMLFDSDHADVNIR